MNLLAVMCHPDVDYTRTVSNDIIEMLQTLGIEAARNALLKELRGGFLRAAGCAVGGGGLVGAGGCAAVGVGWWGLVGAL